MNTLFQATRIWRNKDTRREYQASVCLRWQDVRAVQHDANSGVESWEYQGPVTCLITSTYDYYVLGRYDTWLAQWHNYQNSNAALFLAHN